LQIRDSREICAWIIEGKMCIISRYCGISLPRHQHRKERIPWHKSGFFWWLKDLDADYKFPKG
jgi:hypothetical protein